MLEKAGFDVTLNTLKRRLKKEEMPTLLKDIEGIVAGVEPYTDELFKACPTIRCISRVGIGTDTIDIEAAKKHDIQVVKTTDEVIQPVAENTVAMMLALAKNYSLHINDFQQGLWKKYYGKMIREMTIGLIGFGRIGRKVAELLKPFGANIIVSDPFLKQLDLPSDIKLVSQETLLKISDLVSIHAMLPSDHGPLLGEKELCLMKKDSYLINTARGFMIDHKALEKALTDHHLAGAALDVFEEEPYTGQLTKMPQVLLTPHVSTLTTYSRIAMELKAAENLVAALSRKR